jgi:raffinose/stachyose/melibiose transport system substrate-binding protein
MKVKRIVAVMTATIMMAGILTGCGSNNDSVTTGNKNNNSGNQAQETEPATTAPATEAGEVKDLSGTKISFLNSKGEIQTALEEMAAAFEEETGVVVEIIACGAGESPYTKITSMYNSGTAPTMAMLDTTDIVALAKEHALDLSEELWVSQCENQLTRIDDKVYSFPFCVEGRGLIYNKKAIEDTLGTGFDPGSVNSYDALKKLLEELRAGGMENPVVISKEDWSLGAHQLGFIYDTYNGTTKGSQELIGKLKDGSLKVEDYERYNQFIDTMNLLLDYNINGKDPLGALYEQDPIFLADGEAAIWANGSWAWPNITEAGASSEDQYGFIPFVLGNDTTDFANNAIQASASKQVMIDSTKATENEVAAAKEFINWLVFNEQGQKMLVETAAIIPACTNNTYEALDPLGKDIQTRLAKEETYSSSYIAPSDHWSVLGAAMQKYIAGKSSKEELAASIDNYWTSQK